MSFTPGNIYACLPDVERARPVVLGGDPKGENFIYTHANAVIVRNLKNPLQCFTYVEHAHDVTVAKYAPSGFYIASADVTGTVRIWDTTQEEHMLKYEYRPLSGKIVDLQWSPDSKRIVVCGEGNEKYANAFLWDSGSSVGEIVGHSKYINSIDYKPTRPFRVVTASEDTDTGFFAGPPFKLQHLQKEHSRFVNVVRFSPDGNYYVSGGADGKSCLYDGKEGTFVKSLGGDKAHEGSICGVAWNPDSTQVLTASADKTCKLWDVESGEAVKTFTFGDSLDHQQLGCLWQGDTIITVSLDGNINYLDMENPSAPAKRIFGFLTGLHSFDVSADGSYYVAGSIGGRICKVDIATGEHTRFENDAQAPVNDIAVGSTAVIACNDDKVRIGDIEKVAVNADPAGTDSTPRAVAVCGDITIVVCINEIIMYKGGEKVNSTPIDCDGRSVSIKADGSEFAVGGDNKKVYVYSISGTSWTEKKVLELRGKALAIGYSPDGKWLATGDSDRHLLAFETEAQYESKFLRWRFHSASINCLAWAPSSKYIATGSLDTNAIVWNLEIPNKRITLKAAHPRSSVVKVRFSNDDTLFTAGLDGFVRSWNLTHHK